MARRVYYGTCLAAAGGDNNNEYSVYVNDLDITADSFNFDEGDLLVVFFAFKNTEAEPKLIIYINDTENQPSTSLDEGKFIKTHDVEADCNGAWGDGETVIFAYTQQGTSDTYYWELVNGVHCSTDIFGVTKTFDDEDFTNWIQTPISQDDMNSGESIAPRTLKKLYQLFAGSEDDEELGITWTPNSQLSNLQTLGTLSLSTGMGVNITYPLESFILQYLPTAITHTGQLINNGAGPATTESEPYITKYVDTNDIYFNTGHGLTYSYIDIIEEEPQRIDVSRIILNDANDKLSIGNNENDDSLMGIVLGKPTEINGATNIDGQLTANVGIDNIGIITDGNIQEKNQNLSDRYNSKLKVVKLHDETGLITKGTTSKKNNSAHIHVSVNENGWTPIGVVGYNVNYLPPHSTGDALYANLWECYIIWIEGIPYIEYSLYNMRSQDIYVQIDFYVLYQKNL